MSDRRKMLAAALRGEPVEGATLFGIPAGVGYVPAEIAGPPTPDPAMPYAQLFPVHEAIGAPPPDTLRDLRKAADAQKAVGQFVWEMTPPGSLMAAREAYRNADDFGTAAGIVGAIPGAGPVAKGAKVAKAAAKEIPAYLRAGAEAATAANPRGLPMDEASRMARAKDGGWSAEPLYHATDKAFDQFRVGKAGSGMSVGTRERVAGWLTNNPALADSYLGGQYIRRDAPDALAAGTADLGGNVGRYYSPGSSVMPISVRGLDGFETWEMAGGGYRPGFMEAAIAEARRNKAKGVIFDNVRDPGIMDAPTPIGNPRTPSRVVAVFDPKDLRSRFATFDPQYKGADLMRVLLPMGVGAGAIAAEGTIGGLVPRQDAY